MTEALATALPTAGATVVFAAVPEGSAALPRRPYRVCRLSSSQVSLIGLVEADGHAVDHPRRWATARWHFAEDLPGEHLVHLANPCEE